MPELRRIQPPPVDNQIPTAAPELRSSARNALNFHVPTDPPLLTALDCLFVCLTYRASFSIQTAEETGKTSGLTFLSTRNALPVTPTQLPAFVAGQSHASS